jgi:chemotaxis signal transduction protein
MSDRQPQPLAADSAPPDYHDAILRLLNRPLSEEDVRAATERVAQPLTAPRRDVDSLLVMRVGSEHLALFAVDVARITRVAAVRRIPHRTNAVIRGLCNVNGELLICGSLQSLLGLSEDEGETADGSDAGSRRRRMVVFGDEADRWTVEVDEVEGVVNVETASYLPPPVTVGRALDRYTVSLAPLADGRLAALLDARRLASGFKGALS